MARDESTTGRRELRVYAPDVDRLSVVEDGAPARPLGREGDEWVGSVAAGARYGIIADGRVLVDPMATEVWFPDGHRRDAHRPGGRPDAETSPRAVATPWPRVQTPRRTSRPLVVYEAHVRGMTMRRDRPDAGTFSALVDELPRLARLGISVIELLPVHQFDPDEGNYWGYMPLVFGAVHRRYAAGDDPAAELASFVAAAHDHDVEVWLDVVFNHTTEEDEHGPTYNLRALADDDYYVRRPDGAYADDAGTGNIVDATSPAVQRLVIDALDRFADLGVDGFRFDLASVLARDPDFVRAIGDWAVRRGVRLVAEAWDVVRYQVGAEFPDQRWMQWNDRFRDDVRGFLRSEPGLVGAVVQRVQGSPDLFERPGQSVNYLTAHDGFTLYDLVSYDRKHNEANGWGNTDGPDDNRSWNSGWEGDDGVTDEVMALRRRRLRNALCLLMISHGTPMVVAGDEFGRTQGGNNNAYNQDNETSWVDWSRRSEFADLERFVAGLVELRAQHPILTDDEWWGTRVDFVGPDGPPDLADQSRSIAWTVGDLHVMVNMWWEPLTFRVPAPGEWVRHVDTGHPDGFVEPARVEGAVAVGPRSIVVLIRA